MVEVLKNWRPDSHMPVHSLINYDIDHTNLLLSLHTKDFISSTKSGVLRNIENTKTKATETTTHHELIPQKRKRSATTHPNPR